MTGKGVDSSNVGMDRLKVGFRSAESTRHRFRVMLDRAEVLDVVMMIHAAFSGIFTGTIGLIQGGNSGEVCATRLDRKLEIGSEYRLVENSSEGVLQSTIDSAADAGLRMHAIIDAAAEYEAVISHYVPTTAVCVVAQGAATDVIVTFDRSLSSLGLGHAFEVALRAVAELSPPERVLEHRRYTAMRAALLKTVGHEATSTSGVVPEGFISRLRRHVGENPHQVAIRSAGADIDYSKLWELASTVAWSLQEADPQEHRRVLILGARGVDLVVCVVAAFMTGSVLSIVDPRHPNEYLEACAGIFRPTVVIDLAGRGLGLDLCKTINSHQLRGGGRAGVLPNPAGDCFAPDDCAIVTFTSGTTGGPKAVAGRYGSLTYFFDWMDEEFGPFNDCAFGMCSSIGHDPLQRDIMTPLYLGGSIAIPGDDILERPSELARWIELHQIDVICLNPVLVSALESVGRLESLKLCVFVGGKLSRDQAIRMRQLAVRARIVNIYGSTETQRAVSYFEIPETVDAIANLPAVVPIGHGMKDVRVSVVRPDGQLALPFELGEIVVSSPQISLGYLCDETLTKSKFTVDLPAPHQGIPTYFTGDCGFAAPDIGVICGGRMDGQVKINGHRVEMEEVNIVSRAHPYVADAVTIAIDIDGLPSLATILVPIDDALTLSPLAFKDYLRSKLPRYAVPQHIRTRSSIPLTRNGKLDVRALTKEYFGAAVDDRRDPIEQFVKEHTGMVDVPDDVGLDVLGVDSLRFFSLVTRIVPPGGVRGTVPLRNTMSIRQIQLALSAATAVGGGITTAPDARNVRPRRSVNEEMGAVTKVSETKISFGERTFDHCCSNSYLALSRRADLRGAWDNFASTGLSANAHGSHEVNAFTTYHTKIVDGLCSLHEVDSALLFSSAYLAASTTIAGLAGIGDQIFVDESVHRSILDGCALSRAEIVVFRHNDVDDLLYQIGQHTDTRGQKFVITEGVFSVEGDIADLPTIATIAKAHDCLLIVDEACSVGQIGDNGRGVMEHFGMASSVDLVIGTFAKAFSSSGGYVAGRQSLIDRLRFERGAAFSTGLSPLNAYFTQRMLAIFSDVGPELVSDLQSNAALWREGLRVHGVDTGLSQTAIVPIVCDTELSVRRTHERLLRRGAYAMPIGYPWSLTMHAIRTSVTAAHTRSDLYRLIEVVGSAVSADDESEMEFCQLGSTTVDAAAPR